MSEALTNGDYIEALDALNAVLKPLGTNLKHYEVRHKDAAVLAMHKIILAERERCAAVCEDQAQLFLSPQYASNQPIGSITERFACAECATAIRNGAV